MADRPIRQLPAVTGGRVETGPVQFGDDWPGLFIRGDRSGWLSLQLAAFMNGAADHFSRTDVEWLRQLLAKPIVGPAQDVLLKWPMTVPATLDVIDSDSDGHEMPMPTLPPDASPFESLLFDVRKEYLRWKNADASVHASAEIGDDGDNTARNLELICMGAMGACANILAAMLLKKPEPESERVGAVGQ